MQFILDELEDTYIFRLKDERLNAQIAPDLKAQLLLLIGDEHRNKIILDLSAVNYVDSSGLGALLLASRVYWVLTIAFSRRGVLYSLVGRCFI
jgi:anti-anti-sigma factor